MGECIDAWSPDSRSLATEVTQNGISRILVVNTATGASSFLTPEGVVAHCPVWSPDGAWVAFQNEAADRRDIDVIRADGSGMRSAERQPHRFRGRRSRHMVVLWVDLLRGPGLRLARQRPDQHQCPVDRWAEVGRSTHILAGRLSHFVHRRDRRRDGISTSPTLTARPPTAFSRTRGTTAGPQMVDLSSPGAAARWTWRPRPRNARRQSRWQQAPPPARPRMSPATSAGVRPNRRPRYRGDNAVIPWRSHDVGSRHRPT